MDFFQHVGIKDVAQTSLDPCTLVQQTGCSVIQQYEFHETMIKATRRSRNTVLMLTFDHIQNNIVNVESGEKR